MTTLLDITRAGWFCCYATISIWYVIADSASLKRSFRGGNKNWSSMIGAKLISRLLPAKFKAAGILGSLFGNVVGMAIYGVIKQKVYEPKEIKAQKNGAIKI